MGCFDSFKSNNPFRHSGSHTTHTTGTNAEDVGPPPGPPPSYSRTNPQPPSGKESRGDNNNNNNDDDDYIAPPPGPPPSSTSSSSHPQHDWQSVPLPEDDNDSAGYPPPPALFAGHDRSWSNNATEAQADEGERWCRRYALLPPLRDPSDPSLGRPPRPVPPHANTFSGTIVPSSSSGGGGGGGGRGRGPGAWTVRTDRRSGDSCITVQPPVYVACRDDPRAGAGTGAGRPPKTIYFEVVVPRGLEDPAGLALGFTALPYPPFRMPGWHRGSLAVHSDDGRRYVNDRWGGVDFVEPFGAAGVVGVGMRFSSSAPGGGGGGGNGGNGGSQQVAGKKGQGGAADAIEVECFFTRNGRLDNSWDVNGVRDAERDLEPVGVQGYHDLVIAVGTFEKTEVEIVLDPARWMYKGAQV